MALEPHNQFLEAVKRSRSVAVVLPSEAGIDALGSGLALARFAESYGLPAEVIAPNLAVRPQLSFLPGTARVRPTIANPRNTVITVPFNGELGNLQHEHNDGVMKITLSPKSGAIDFSNLSVSHSEWRHNLIIVVGVREPKEIGSVFADHRQFFEETTVVNVDSHPANEQHGHINLVDLKTSSISELVAGLIEKIDAKRLDKETATCLLAGIMSETKSFRSPTVTPRTLETASRLVERGAERELIVEALFRTRPVETLRLWGRVLARLRADREHNIVWSVLSRQDFIQAGADETHLSDVIEELVSRAPDSEIICIFHEHPSEETSACALVSTERGWNALDLTLPWHPTGTHKQARVKISGTNLPTLEQNILTNIRQTVAKHKNR